MLTSHNTDSYLLVQPFWHTKSGVLSSKTQKNAFDQFGVWSNVALLDSRFMAQYIITANFDLVRTTDGTFFFWICCVLQSFRSAKYAMIYQCINLPTFIFWFLTRNFMQDSVPNVNMPIFTIFWLIYP